jgi:hypothetical protein
MDVRNRQIPGWLKNPAEFERDGGKDVPLIKVNPYV